MALHAPLSLLVVFLVMCSATDQSDQCCDRLQEAVLRLSKQVQKLELHIEESIRSSGDSGLGHIRSTRRGNKNYMAESHTGRNIAGVHNHANHRNIVGAGEFSAFINGVFFRTRHNDYPLVMKSLTSTEYKATEDIPFTEVPPEVLSKTTVEEQIAEMKLWFQAFKDQDRSQRDYRKYFKPVLCYLEGAWLKTKDQLLEEPFQSDRHRMNADRIDEMNAKIVFTSATGLRDPLQNFAYLPSKIYAVGNDGMPYVAQWTYSIRCHPLSRDLPLSRLRSVDDMKTRVSKRLATKEDYEKSITARFQINAEDSDTWNDKKFYTRTFLDEFMGEIPGMDNYPGNLTEEAYGAVSYELTDNPGLTPLNAAYYNRAYKSEKPGASGLNTRTRAFDDSNVYVAHTTQSRVVSFPPTLDMDTNNTEHDYGAMGRVSYAIPLEIVYLTPLSRWNPYNLEYKGHHKSPEGQSITEGGRDGKTPETAFNGINTNTYYQTPLEFFGDEAKAQKADTTKDGVYVLDGSSRPVKVRASGTRIILPKIEGVGDNIRLRYPIMSIHGEGSSVWKELNALKDMQPQSRPPASKPSTAPESQNSPEETPGQLVTEITTTPVPGADVNFTMSVSTIATGSHTHLVTLTAAEYQQYLNRVEVLAMTGETAGHSHRLTLRKATSGGKVRNRVLSCDHIPECSDGHQNAIFRLNNCGCN